MAHRSLKPAEIQLAYSVFRDTIPYDRVFLETTKLGDAPVTAAGVLINDGRFIYRLLWPEGYNDVMGSAERRSTFIHELTHAWQGENGVWPTFYMGQSLIAQGWAGVRDVLRTREWKGWGTHRSTAYKFPASDLGRRWDSFNVEQQASIVESWFIPERERVTRVGRNRIRTHNFGPDVYGGGASPHDARFPYIRDVIRARRRNAPYSPVALAPGADSQMKAIQDKLVALNYLEARHADGFVGRSRSATLDAVAEFQRRHGLRVDRDLGGPNSETRRRLAQPVGSLARAP